MTPDTPFFDMSSAGGMFGKSVGSDVGGDIVPAEPEWTEEEDEMLQSVSTARVAFGVHGLTL